MTFVTLETAGPPRLSPCCQQRRRPHDDHSLPAGPLVQGADVATDARFRKHAGEELCWLQQTGVEWTCPGRTFRIYSGQGLAGIVERRPLIIGYNAEVFGMQWFRPARRAA